ncbi:hypothetical protein EC988_000087 [Linderina pennispora]|nr:hypothetical protein EC988_000087 [Linderina pennispora]
MSAQKSFLDGYSMDSSLSGTQMSVLHSNDNSQNETVFDSQPVMAMRPPASSQHTGSSAGEEVRRLHQDHKALKRSLDRLGQEMASSFTSLHEKTSKVNLSVSDLHSDLKKVERSVMFDRDMSSPSVADIELKLSSTGKHGRQMCGSGCC